MLACMAVTCAKMYELAAQEPKLALFASRHWPWPTKKDQNKDRSRSFLYPVWEKIHLIQGCVLALSSGPWLLTFAIGQLGNLSFFIEILCWVAWISQVQSTWFPWISFFLEHNLDTFGLGFRFWFGLGENFFSPHLWWYNSFSPTYNVVIYFFPPRL